MSSSPLSQSLNKDGEVISSPSSPKDYSTSGFQHKQTYYQTIEECVLHRRTTFRTNPRYNTFSQTHFTAGDAEQFETYRGYQKLSFDIPSVKNEGLNPPNIDRDKYSNIDGSIVSNTFDYIFNKFKKGIFVRIKDNALETFLPFSKFNFTNEWSNRVRIDRSKYNSMDEFFRKVSNLSGYDYNPNHTNKFKDKWYANNGIIRYEFPIAEGDSGACQIHHMLETLCENRKVPDMEFFVNRRDFPILKKNNTEPYTHLFGNNKPLVSHDYEKYCPILSMTTGTEFSDIAIPTWDDWSRIMNQEEGIFFPKTERNFDLDFSETKWEDKKAVYYTHLTLPTTPYV